MPVCVRCRREVGLLSGLVDFNRKTQRCGNCDRQVKDQLLHFRNAFLTYCKDGILSPQEWHYLQIGSVRAGLDWDEALEFIRTDTLYFLERTLTFIAEDGIITEEEAGYFQSLIQQLQLSPELVKPLTERLIYQRRISDIRQGKLATIRATIHLEPNELCYLEDQAIYEKIKAKGIQFIPGRLIVTDKKIHFLSDNGGWTIIWKNIMRVERDSRSIYLELATQKGNGRYQIPDPLLAEAILNTLTRLAKRQLLIPQEGNESRHIPQDIKIAVWQRDQGKCVQCGNTSYLEFDHIIPFSKGGASTTNNVQLLCRKCNLEKGDRI